MESKKKNNTSNGVKSGVCAGAKAEKTKVSCYFMPHTLAEVDHIYKSDNCSTRTEFIEKAVRFYLGYLNEESGVNYISPMITETVKAEIKGTEQRLARLMFKVAVELGKLSHMLAAVNEIDEETLSDLHTMCINEVRKINGIINYEDAVDYQHS